MKKSVRNRVAVVGLAVALGLLASGCAGASPGAEGASDHPGAADCYEGTPLGESMAGLYQAATEAGKTGVTVYGPGAINWKPLVANFNKCFPDISANLVNLVGSETTTRIQAEFASGQHTGDIVFGPINNGAFQPEHEEWLEPFAPLGGKELVHHPDDLWYAPYAGLFGFAYNTNNVDAADVPRSWDELLDPKWKGRLAGSDLTKQGAGTQTLLLAYLDGRIDDAWMTAYADQDASALPDAASVGRSIITGEKDLAIYPLSFVTADKVKGAPIAFIPELAIFGYVTAGMLRDAPNPDASKLLLSWLLTDQAQKDFSLQGQYGLMPNAPLPDGFTSGNHKVNKPAGHQQTVDVTNHILKFWAEHQK